MSANAYEPTDFVDNAAKPLLRWPAIILVLLIFGLPRLPGLFEAPSLPLFMTAFMGPAAVAIAILLWWLFASRATWTERLTGAAVVIVAAALSLTFCDRSMQGMGGIISIIPMGAVAFAIPLVLLYNKPAIRLPVALVVALLTFGYWDLVRSNGVDGRFQADYAWRWERTAEEKHLESIASSGKDPAATSGTTAEGSLPAVNFTSAEWPAFRGPDRSGHMPGIVLESDWTNNPPKEIWKTTVGPGWSSFAVALPRLFTQEQRGDKEAVVCLHADTGKPIWSHEYESRFWESVAGAGPRATPTLAARVCSRSVATESCCALNQRLARSSGNATSSKSQDARLRRLGDLLRLRLSWRGL